MADKFKASRAHPTVDYRHYTESKVRKLNQLYSNEKSPELSPSVAYRATPNGSSKKPAKYACLNTPEKRKEREASGKKQPSSKSVKERPRSALPSDPRAELLSGSQKITRAMIAQLHKELDEKRHKLQKRQELITDKGRKGAKEREERRPVTATRMAKSPQKEAAIAESGSVMNGRSMSQSMKFGKATRSRSPVKEVSLLELAGLDDRAKGCPAFKRVNRAKREIFNSGMIYNLFFHYVSNVVIPKGKIKYTMGKGNNASLVARILEQRSLVETHSTPASAHLVWSQNYVADSRPTSILSAVKYNFKHLNGMPYFKELDLNSVECLTEELAKARLFKFDKSLATSCFSKLIKTKRVSSVISENINIVNHIRGLKPIAHKANLAQTIIDYCKEQGTDPFTTIPATYFLRGAHLSSDLEALVKQILSTPRAFTVPYIVKPGEFFNRGKGISMAFSEADLRRQCLALFDNSKSLNAVVQAYIAQPLLFKGRKFDIRCYALLVKMFKRASVFWYEQGYIRTSSYDYDLEDRSNLMVHLTNEAVQVKNKDTFGKFEPGNKVYYPEMEEYCSQHPAFLQQNKSFLSHIIPDIKVGSS